MKQLSVFMENREGRLEEVLEILKNKNINILSLSLADSSEFGMLRLIVSDPETGALALKENGISARLTQVLAVKIPHCVGGLQKILIPALHAGINIEYIYALETSSEDAVIVLKTSDLERTRKVFEEAGVELVKSETL